MGVDCSDLACPAAGSCADCPGSESVCVECVPDSDGQCVYGQSVGPITSTVTMHFLLQQSAFASRRRLATFGQDLKNDLARILQMDTAQKSLLEAPRFENVSVPDRLWKAPICTVTVYGDGNFSGLQTTFAPGRYTVTDMEIRGARNDDIESLHVSWGCECHLWSASLGGAGWNQVFGAGDYDAAAMEATAAKINDASAMIVTQVMTAPRPVALLAEVQLTAELPQSRLFREKIAPPSFHYKAQKHPDSGRTIHVLQTLSRLSVAELRSATIMNMAVLEFQIDIACPNECSRNAVSCNLDTGHCKCQAGYYREDCGCVCVGMFPSHAVNSCVTCVRCLSLCDTGSSRAQVTVAVVDTATCTQVFAPALMDLPAWDARRSCALSIAPPHSNLDRVTTIPARASAQGPLGGMSANIFTAQGIVPHPKAASAM